MAERRGKKEEGRGKKEEGRGKKEEGRRKKDLVIYERSQKQSTAYISAIKKKIS
ncbi:hypothetical protein QUA71_14535 [Microcoleus sp. MON1_C5]|uniref:hypothetical protein n=1 Tax=Microcoleus sp. MON1_C5 TaxID=2818828 RepID=UPI002FD2A93A